MTHVPSFLEIVLLALAAFRLWRLAAWDVITRPARQRIIGRTDDGHLIAGLTYRRKTDELVHCPWCLGAWISIGWWLAWLAWPVGTLIAATPFAISAAAALVEHNLDRDD